MKLKLLGVTNPNYSTLEQILVNRNIPYDETHHYMNTTDADISDPATFGENLQIGAKMLVSNVQKEANTLVICDCDCDGFTAAALLINYLQDLFPSFVENNLKWWVHEGKQHGLADCMDYINLKDFQFIIVPDAGSNDYELHKELSGVGVTWQFCRYLDNLMGTSYADYYIDLVALGNTGDMMSLTSIETRYLISEGFKPNNIHNPYIYEMWQKNKFKLGEHISSIDAAFYIVPMINAVQRSGTIEEKELLFKSMLKYEAFKMILSNKRGHKVGEMERLVDQAVRMSTNVKNRQTRAQDAAMADLEKIIEEQHLLDHKVILFTLDEGQIDRNIGGLIANKIANEYQRPCCILTKSEAIPKNDLIFDPTDEYYHPTFDLVTTYQGSARGYEATGITNFKTICEECGAEWAQGHENAFGMCLAETAIQDFLTRTDERLASISVEPIYYVDYIYKGADIQPDDILVISSLKNLWGKDFDESLVAVEDLKISKDMVTVYRKTGNTLKITLSNGISLMKFNATDDECFNLENFTGAYISMNIVGKCNRNEWMGNVSPQIFIEDYEITGTGKYLF